MENVAGMAFDVEEAVRSASSYNPCVRKSSAGR
jgi:hypothetical protein